MPIIAMSFVLALVLGSGVSVAAHASVPGDALYPFKIDVTERVEEALAQGDQAKIDMHIAAMHNRLTEAQALAQVGKLTANAQATITANFAAHVGAVQAAIANLGAKGDQLAAAELAAKFQATVAQETAQLTDASSKVSLTEQTALLPVLVHLQNTYNTAAALSATESTAAAALVQ